MLEQYESKKYMLLFAVPAFVVCIFLCMVNLGNIVGSVRVIKNVEVNDYALVSKSDYDEASNKVIFNNITTTEESYNKFKIACNNVIDIDKDEGSTDISTNVQIGESEVYIDNPDNVEIKTEKNDEHTMYEAYVIYFQDKILITYVNELGNMQVLTSGYKLRTRDDLFNSNYLPESILAVRKTGKAYSLNSYTLKDSYLLFGDSNYVKNQYSSSFKRAMTEQEYINSIVDILIETMRTDTTENADLKFRKKALDFFTKEAYNNIIYGSDNIGRAEEIDVKVNILEAGSTEIGGIKNRIFIQLKILQNDKVVTTNIIAKFNEYNKVFDIDIL